LERYLITDGLWEGLVCEIMPGQSLRSSRRLVRIADKMEPVWVSVFSLRPYTPVKPAGWIVDCDQGTHYTNLYGQCPCGLVRVAARAQIGA